METNNCIIALRMNKPLTRHILLILKQQAAKLGFLPGTKAKTTIMAIKYFAKILVYLCVLPCV